MRTIAFLLGCLVIVWMALQVSMVVLLGGATAADKFDATFRPEHHAASMAAQAAQDEADLAARQAYEARISAARARLRIALTQQAQANEIYASRFHECVGGGDPMLLLPAPYGSRIVAACERELGPEPYPKGPRTLAEVDAALAASVR